MSAPKPSKPTLEKLLDAGEVIMVAQGYVATSVDRVCQEAGVTKGSFFHYFKSKEDMGKRLLSRFIAKQKDMFSQACEGIDDPLARVFRMIDVWLTVCQVEQAKGCLVGTFAQEISQTHPELRAICQACFDEFSQQVGQDLLAAKKLHAPQENFDAESLGAFFLSLSQGSMVVARTNGQSTIMEKNLLHLRAYLNVLFNRG